MGARSAIRRYAGGEEVSELPGIIINASSNELKWRGLQLELASSNQICMDRMTASGHYLSVNLSNEDVVFQVRGPESWEWDHIPPFGFWILPEGDALSVRQSGHFRYANCLVDSDFLDAVVGHHYQLASGRGILNPALAHIFQALIAILQEPQPYSRRMVDDLIHGFVTGLAAGHGYAPTLEYRGGISPGRLRALLTWLDEHFQEPLTVGAMAARVGLSEAHFSREFKRSTGQTPWSYVVKRRLEAAHERLIAGESIGTVALHFGFSDQSHLSRVFKQHFGLSPSAFVRSRQL